MLTVRHGDAVHKVPCGKCAFCLTNRRAQWMFRIHHEIKDQKHPGYFLTLTYDEKHVKRVADGRLSLRFYDVQLFIKRIRKAKFYVKYICVGEYGGSTHRPHYHMLLWTDAPTDFLQGNWKSSKDNSIMGSIHFGSVTMQSAMYCLKYIIQPKQRVEDVISPDGEKFEVVEKTRAQFSKGLGLTYLTTEVYDYHTFDYNEPVVFSRIDGKKVALPRYYKNKIFTPYQMGEERLKSIEESITKKADAVRKLLDSGICKKLPGCWKYLDDLRVIQAQRIIATTKFNQTL